MDEKMEVFEKHRTDPSEEDKNINREENVLPDFDMIDKTGHETKRTRPTKQVPDVIIIEDDDEIGEVENNDTSNMDDFCDDDYDSDSGSRKFQSCSNRPAGGQSADGFSAGHSEFSDSSDEDDCFVMNHEPMEPGPSRLSWCLHRRVPKGEKRPAHNMFNLNNMRKSSSSSSDCEIIEDLDGKVRQDWEKAALKKRLGDAFNGGIYRAESEESTSASNLAGSVARQSLHGKTKGQAQQNEMSKQGQSEPRQSGPSNFPFPKERESTPVTLFDQQDSNNDCPDARSEDASDLAGEGTSVSETASISSGNDAESFEERTSSSHLNAVQIGSSDDYLSGVLPPEEDFLVPERESDDLQQQQVAAEAVLKSSDDLFVDREKIKETEEFRHAEEEEWARRQQELQRQAQEAQRQRKKRKVEAERRMEMESRQKQRLEEIRQIQQKEEQNLGYKEQVRGRIRSELEDVAATCIDMATLLRNLGVEVDGGVFPSIQQVNAAYKKALLRFHPDRVAASAKSDPLHQVEAEETFKLISKMKNTLQPVALSYY